MEIHAVSRKLIWYTFITFPTTSGKAQIEREQSEVRKTLDLPAHNQMALQYYHNRVTSTQQTFRTKISRFCRSPPLDFPRCAEGSVRDLHTSLGTPHVNIHSTCALQQEDHWRRRHHPEAYACCLDDAMRRNPLPLKAKKCSLLMGTLEISHMELMVKLWAVVRVHVRTCLLIVRN